MRTRTEIEKEHIGARTNLVPQPGESVDLGLILEVLLDIRDILSVGVRSVGVRTDV